MDRAFQVDLRGVVDLLSHHLYGSPRVYVRELLQNAVDAITARNHKGEISLETGDTLRVHDNGIGLTEDEVHELLATIGRSSKRDDLGFARHDFLGQFGIGLLSCFLVADEVHVTTKSAKADDAEIIEWRGYADGRYRVTRAVTKAAEEREPGTTVTLIPRPGMEHWLSARTVTDLVHTFGELLPVPVTVNGETTRGVVPWREAHADPDARGEALAAYCEEVFGFTPFDVIDLHVPEAGLTGVAFVLPAAANPAARAGHRVYLKRMLLAESVERLLPDWAFFVRCVVDTGELRPTANREALYEDDLLETTRQALGTPVRDWLVKLAATQPARMRQFLGVHSLGVKALALHDVEMLRLVDQWLPLETNAGPMPLAEFRRKHPTVRYTVSVEEFRQLAGVASAQGIGVVNGGYTYDTDILQRLPLLDPDITVSRLDPAELATHFDLIDPAAALAARPFLTAAAQRLDRLGCEVVLRSFDPPSLPALYLVDREATHAAELRATREAADELWSDVLSSFDTAGTIQRPQLVLNHRNPLVRRISALGDRRLEGLAVEALYGQALLLGHHPLRAADTALLNRSFLGLLDWAVHPGENAVHPGENAVHPGENEETS